MSPAAGGVNRAVASTAGKVKNAVSPIVGRVQNVINKVMGTKVGKLIKTGEAMNGVRNVTSEDGVAKTARLASNGEYGKAIVSGIGDVMDISDVTGAGELVKGTKLFANAPKVLNKVRTAFKKGGKINYLNLFE